MAWELARIVYGVNFGAFWLSGFKKSPIWALKSSIY